jgi:type IX secretion system PorP/SprF family membrane protein
MLKKKLLSVIFLIHNIVGYGQDMHFSQANNFPMLINPAYSGMFEGKTRAIFSARNQNLLVPNTAFTGVYNTISASVETKIFEDMTDQNTWSVGLTLLSDYAGSGTLSTTQALLHTGYSLAMDRYGQSFLSFSAQAGITNRRLFSNDLLFESQISEFEFDPRLPNLEPFIDGSSQTNFLLNVGAVYQQQLGENTISQLGFSLYNINQPKQFFYANSKENIYSRMNITGGLLFKLDDVSKLYPSVVYMKQGSFHSLNMGMSYTRELSESVSLIGGLRHRLGDAFILLAGMKYNKFQSTISYDITTSSLSKSNKTVGALELNLTYIFGESKESYGSDKMYCPSY